MPRFAFASPSHLPHTSPSHLRGSEAKGGMAARARNAKRWANTLAVSLREPLQPTLPHQASFHVPEHAPKTNVDALENGVRVASEDTMGPAATLGLYVDAGSVYESSANSGMSHLLERIAFRTTQNRTHFRLVREVEAMGANLLANASREQMAYTIDGPRHNMPEMAEVLVDAVINPKFQPWEIKEQVERIKEEVDEAEKNHQSFLMEALHQTGYTGGLGMPLVAVKDVVQNLSTEDCVQYVNELYTGPRMVVAASGVSQDALVSAAQPLLSGLSSSPGPATPPTQYVGGDYRRRTGGNMVHLVLGFEAPGGWRDFKASVVATLLQMLMGGGGSFSAGGPGKGMYSRLYTRILNKYAWMQNCTFFTSLFNDTGLMGINISAESYKADQAVGAICDEMLALTKKGAITDTQLERAKLALISSVYMNLESKVVVAEDIGRQILTYGHRKAPSEFVEAVQQVTATDIQKAMLAMFKKPPTIACCGDISGVPHFDAIKSRF
mmetsp:Transcript_9373/g.33016  ORF Transcript_9373/g.33016 Transcript_9373/m.33016 type:complete len:497 (-) Transcript_9373:1374-2864(-)